MYQHKTEDFGPYKKHILFNPENGNLFSVVPEHGATLLQLHINGQAILDGFDTPKELKDDVFVKNRLLFPFPNRLRDGAYEVNGKPYQFPINCVSQNALHGCDYDRSFGLRQIKVNEFSGRVSCLYYDWGNNPAYPFPHSFEVVYTLSDLGNFEVQLSFVNNSTQEIPVGFGWHPYFKINDRIDDLKIHLPPSNRIEVDDRLLPTGEKSSYISFEKIQPIGAHTFDTCFELNQNRKKEFVHLESSLGQLLYWQETGKGKFNFFQLYTPDDRKSIAIEPMTCNIDAFNNKDGLTMLAPKERLVASCGIRFTPTEDIHFSEEEE